MKLAFDLDGTLITGEQRQIYLLKAISSRYGLKLDYHEIWSQKREGKNNFGCLINLGIDRKVVSKICSQWVSEIESSYWLSLDTLFIDTYQVLKSLNDRKIDISIITARENESYMLFQLQNLGISRFFSNIYCVNPNNGVADKDVILRSNSFTGFIGDSEVDIQSSCLADVKFCAVSTGQRSKDFLLNNGATCVANSLSEALKLMRITSY
jgi:phosphoglycolate phosphatase-like HAD superfamily hydrolase